MTDLADRLEEASRGWEAAYLNIASALFAEAAREYRAALRRVEALEAGLREIALNQVEVFDEEFLEVPTVHLGEKFITHVSVTPIEQTMRSSSDSLEPMTSRSSR